MKSNALNYGLKMFAGLAIFFILMNLIGLGHITELRAFNIVIVIFFTNKLAKKNFIEGGGKGYLSNLISLFTANIINVFLSLIGFIIYVKLIDADYLNVVMDSLIWIPTKNLSAILIALFLEGMAGTAIVSFGIMQYWKDHESVKKSTT